MHYAKSTRAGILIVVFTLIAFTGCGGGHPPTYREGNVEREYRASPPARKDASGSRRVALEGSAALYYMWKKNEEARQQGMAVPPYHLSNSGGVYFHDRAGNLRWVRPPAAGLTVSEQEARLYHVDEFQGYDGQESGRSLAGIKSSTF